MPSPYEHTERHTGQEAIVKVGTREIFVTNVSWDKDVNSTDVQKNNSLWPTHATTGLRTSGSFDYDGTAEEFRNTVWYQESDQAVQDGYHQAGEPKRLTMTVKEEDPTGDSSNLPRTWTFTNMMVTGQSRDNPSDDVSSTSWDFVAEQVD